MLTCSLLFASVQARAELPFTHFTPEGGAVRLPSASVQRVFQDRAGHIWLAFFSSGVARYDGRTMQSFGFEAGLTNLTVRELAQDPSGRLWVGTAAGLLVSHKPVDDPRPVPIQFVSRVGAVALPSEPMRRGAMVVDRDGWVSVAVRSGILQLRFGTDGRLVSRSIPLDTGQAALAIGRDGALLVGFPDGRVARARQGTLTVEATRDARIDGREPITIFESRRGDLLLGTVAGAIWRRRPGAGGFEPIASHATERVTGFAETRDGRVWAATLGSGLLSISPGALEAKHYSRRDGLLGETLWSVLLDREGNLWIGQNGGLSRLRYDFGAFESLTAISHVGEKPVLADPGCFATLPPRVIPATPNDPASWLWIATGGGVTIVGPGGETRVLNVANGLASNADYGLGSDERGTIWIATSRGLNAVVFGNPPPWRGVASARPMRLFDRDATLVSFDRKDTTYRSRTVRDRLGERVTCSGSVAGLSCLVDGAWIQFGSAAGLSHVYDFEFDDSGHLWVARYDAGVHRSRAPLSVEDMRRMAREGTAVSSGHEITRPVFQYVEGGGRTARAIEIWNGEVWSGVAGGVAIFRNGVRKAFLGPDQLGGEVASAIAPSPQGTIWIAQNNGLIELDRNRRVIRRVSARDGLVADEAWSAGALVFGSDGRLYFATPSGVSIVRTAAIGRNPHPPALRVEAFEQRETNDGLNEISIAFAALSFANEENVRYRTRLAGYEEQWSAPTTNTSLRYTNLPAWVVPRRYVFEVMAANNDGVWSQPHRLAFTIRPAWWRTWWAYGAFAAAAAILVIAFLRLRTRRLAAHNRELLRTVEARTAELREQTREMALLDGIVETINRETSFDRLFRALIEQGVKLLPQTEKAIFFVVDRERNELTVEATIGHDRARFEALGFTVEDATRRYSDRANALADGIAVVHEHEFEGLFAGDRMSAVHPLPKTMLTMRVGVGETADGFLIFDNFSDGQAFAAVDVETLTRFRQHALSAIGKARMLREVRAANQAKSAFLAKMSHEIRTPLNAILGFVQLMLRTKGRSDEDRQSLSIVMRSGEHLLGLINDVLSMAKIEAGRLTVNQAVFDCSDLLRSVAETVSVRAASKELGVDLEAGDFPAGVRGDSGKLRQVLLNLLDNAIKFTAAGRIVMRARWHEGRAFFEVEDNGTGMTSAETARLFQPFVQSASGNGQEGTGLGLAICRSFVELMGGTIDVTSEPGRGSRFAFDVPLPAAEGTATPERRRVVALVEGQPRLRFLVADDTEENRILLDRLFGSLGFEVRCVTDGRAAVDVWSAWKPDLVWMDIRMPILDGYDATRAIRAAEGTGPRRTVIIGLTASAFEHDRQRLIDAGCDDYVTKPFLEESLFEKISVFLGVRWIYEAMPEVAAAPKPHRTVIPQAIRLRLTDALLRGDIVAARLANQDLGATDPTAAERIGEWIKAYRFDDIQALVDAAGE